MSRWATCVLLAGALLGAAVPLAAAPAELPETEVARLSAQLDVLDADPAMAGKAGLERLLARQAVAVLQVAKSRDRAHAQFMAATRVEAAQDASQAELLMQQSAQLDRERDQIMVESSRREAAAARHEADLLRLQSLAREEEAQRDAEVVAEDRVAADQTAAQLEVATAQASQAMKLADARAKETALARREAELAAAVAADSMESGAKMPPVRRSGRSAIYTLPGSAFASGSANLTVAAQASLRRLAATLGGRPARVEAHTDSQGSDAANLALSQKRADAVRQVLLTAGARRLTALGKGEADPLADNASPEGRARNRRVEIIQE